MEKLLSENNIKFINLKKTINSLEVEKQSLLDISKDHWNIELDQLRMENQNLK